MSTFLEADELVCRINVYDPKEVSDFFVALGGSVVDSAGQKGNGESTLKVGEGLISILKSANHNYFYPEMSVQMNKADQSIWTSRFESQLDSKVRSKTKLEINSPSGPRRRRGHPELTGRTRPPIGPPPRPLQPSQMPHPRVSS